MSLPLSWPNQIKQRRGFGFEHASHFVGNGLQPFGLAPQADLAGEAGQPATLQLLPNIGFESRQIHLLDTGADGAKELEQNGRVRLRHLLQHRVQMCAERVHRLLAKGDDLRRRDRREVEAFRHLGYFQSQFSG